MFKTRILLAFVALALVAIAQGVIGYFAMITASQNVQKGRVANELLVGYMDLLSNKQLLRTQLTNEMTGLEFDPQQSQVFYYNMIRSLDTLDRLAETAKGLSKGDQELVPEHMERSESLIILRKGVNQLGSVMTASDWKFDAVTPQAKRQKLDQIFDVSDGQDLRVALMQSIARERLVTARDRAAADVSLNFMTNVVITASIGLTLFLVFLAFYFVKSLSKPVSRLIRGAEALQAGDLSYRVPAFGHDEFSQVARSMNDMAREIARLRASDQQVREQLEVQVIE
ncbi:HAMP domain-containing protein [Limnobacter sp.]|uniref:HAMP domain-containing protein n=1 Tax=Limnobacter sp. TaxID=2003368 RepID=UPI0037490C5B